MAYIIENKYGLLLAQKGTFELRSQVGGITGYRMKVFRTEKGAQRWIKERTYPKDYAKVINCDAH
jgi:hypothetical protein